MNETISQKYREVLNNNFESNSLTCLRPEVFECKLDSELPLMLNIEPTNACNCRCTFCPREITAKKHGIFYMDFDLYKSIIDQIAGQRLLMLNFHKDGEPLLHKDLPRMIAYAKKSDAAQIVHFNTNGLLLNDDIAKEVIDAGVDDITVSVDAATEETFYKLKRVHGLEKVESGLRKIIEYCKQKKAHTVVRAKIMEFDGISHDEIETFRERWTGVATQVQVDGMHTWGGAVGDPKGKGFHRWVCPLPWYIMAINSDGSASKCNYDWDHSGVIGDTKRETIREIWKGAKVKACRNALLSGNIEDQGVCRKCEVWCFFKDFTKMISEKRDFL